MQSETEVVEAPFRSLFLDHVHQRLELLLQVWIIVLAFCASNFVAFLQMLGSVLFRLLELGHTIDCGADLVEKQVYQLCYT